MSLTSLVNEPCTITPDNGPAVDTVCYAEQQAATEDTVNADHQTDTWRIVLLPDTDIDGHATISIPDRDLTLEVEGPPHPVRNPRTRVIHHIELTAARTV